MDLRLTCSVHFYNSAKSLSVIFQSLPDYNQFTYINYDYGVGRSIDFDIGTANLSSGKYAVLVELLVRPSIQCNIVGAATSIPAAPRATPMYKREERCRLKILSRG